MTLRAEAIAAIRRRLAVRPDSPVQRAAAAVLWTEVALRQTDALWWIAHQDDLTTAFQAVLTVLDREQLRKIHQAPIPAPASGPDRATLAATPDVQLGHRNSHEDQSLNARRAFAAPDRRRDAG